MRHEPLSPYARKTWALLAALGLTGAGFLLALHPLLGLVSAIVLGVVIVLLIEPGSGRLPQPRDARLLARQAAWDAGWSPSPQRSPSAPATPVGGDGAHTP
jgi:hypothetical protein